MLLNNPGSEKSPLERKKERAALKRKLPAGRLENLCRNGAALDEIAGRLSVSRQQAAVEISRLLRKSCDIDPGGIIGRSKMILITDKFRELNTASLKRIKESCADEDEITEADIRIVRGYLAGRMANGDFQF